MIIPDKNYYLDSDYFLHIDYDYIYNQLDKLNINYDKNLIEKLNLSDSKYFGNIMVANDGFYRGLKKLFLLIKDNPDKSIKEILNNLPNNKITKIEFEKYGIDYDKWVNFNKNFYITIKNNSNDESKNLIVRKVDMNDIAKVMFLGNEVSCCTKVGNGTKQETVPNYIMNKLIGAIEVLDSGIPVANTMCYFAKVNDNVAFIIDNVELLPEYKNNNVIRDAIFEYAKILSSEIVKPNIPIYITGHRNKIDLDNFKTDYLPMLILGNSGDNNVYIYFLTSLIRIDSDKYKYKYYDAELTKIN